MKRDVAWRVLPDERLEKRLGLLVEQLSKTPGQSIPQACGSVHDSKAAYRFLG
jgi:transposase-like protein